MSILFLLLSLINFAFGAPIFKDGVHHKPVIESCANGGCFEQTLPR